MTSITGDLFRPLTIILSQNQAEQREDVTNGFENISEIKRFVWNYKANTRNISAESGRHLF